MQKKSKFNVFIFMMLTALGLTFQPAISTYAACPDDISSYWKLDELTPGTYVDFIKDNDGTGNDNPTAVAGQINGAQEFDGLTTGIDVPADRSFNWTVDESFTIEFWVRRNGAVGAEQVAIGMSAGPPGSSLTWWLGIEPVNNAASFVLGDSDGGLVVLSGATDITNGVWHHVVAVRDRSLGANGQNLLYVDGQLDVAALDATYNDGFYSATAALNIGYWNFQSTMPSNHFGGTIDEVALYDRALTAAEIGDHYDAGLSGDGVQSLRPAPVADAGADQNVAQGAAVTLDGTGSTDAYDGTIDSYAWTQTAGTTQVTLAGAATDTATFTAPAVSETLTFQLTVTDNDGLTDTDTIDVTVDNIAGDDDDDDGGGGGGGGGGCFINTMF